MFGSRQLGCEPTEDQRKAFAQEPRDARFVEMEVFLPPQKLTKVRGFLEIEKIETRLGKSNNVGFKRANGTQRLGELGLTGVRYAKADIVPHVVDERYEAARSRKARSRVLRSDRRIERPQIFRIPRAFVGEPAAKRRENRRLEIVH